MNHDCPVCGSKMKKWKWTIFECPNCKHITDIDKNSDEKMDREQVEKYVKWFKEQFTDVFN